MEARIITPRKLERFIGKNAREVEEILEEDRIFVEPFEHYLLHLCRLHGNKLNYQTYIQIADFCNKRGSAFDLIEGNGNLRDALFDYIKLEENGVIITYNQAAELVRRVFYKNGVEVLK